MDRSRARSPDASYPHVCSELCLREHRIPTVYTFLHRCLRKTSRYCSGILRCLDCGAGYHVGDFSVHAGTRRLPSLPHPTKRNPSPRGCSVELLENSELRQGRQLERAEQRRSGGSDNVSEFPCRCGRSDDALLLAFDDRTLAGHRRQRRHDRFRSRHRWALPRRRTGRHHGRRDRHIAGGQRIASVSQ